MTTTEELARCMVVTPWHKETQRDQFLSAWGEGPDCHYLVLQQDKDAEGCGVTKNKGVREAMRRGAETVVVLDDDCFPTPETPTLTSLMMQHLSALQPQPVRMFECVTDPPSRGTPYGDLTMTMPVAASMGFWTEIGDYCAVRQLAFASEEMEHFTAPIHGRYFPLCGMNLAFRPKEWMPWWQFIDVPRFDDIWMGWIWQRAAYEWGHCFNLAGPKVRHSRQSDVWRNLVEEAKYLKENEVLWRKIAAAKEADYKLLIELLPV